MARVTINADTYAAQRQGIFFPGVVPSLDGQCVSLIKWFLAEMTDVPNPQAARGDARYVGKRLVAEGLAIEVPYDQRRPGDIITNEYGTYGHIYLQLSGGRVFEENANVGGVARRLIVDGKDSWYVYASRIGSESEAFRRDVHVYRIKSYNDGGDDMPIPNADNYYNRYRKAMIYIRGRDMSREEFNKNFVGNSDLRMLEAMLDSSEADAQVDYANWGRTAKNDNWTGQIQGLTEERDKVNYPKINAATQGLGLPVDATADQIGSSIASLKAEVAGGNEAALKQIIDEKQRQLDEVTGNFGKLATENDNLKAELSVAKGDTELLNGFGKWLTALIARLGLKNKA